MKSLVTTAIVGLALLAATPAVHRSQSLSAQTGKAPRDEPKPQQPQQQPRSQPAPRQDPPPGRADAPSNDRPTPPPPPPPKSTGEPELKRRNP